MDVEVLPPPPDFEEQPKVRLAHVRGVGIFGTFLAILTMATAFSVGLFAVFGTSLLAAGLIALTWPLIFSVEFTQWIFGTPRAEFWRLFLLLLVAGTVVKILRIRK